VQHPENSTTNTLANIRFDLQLQSQYLGQKGSKIPISIVFTAENTGFHIVLLLVLKKKVPYLSEFKATSSKNMLCTPILKT
jgi:hypothetical protein